MRYAKMDTSSRYLEHLISEGGEVDMLTQDFRSENLVTEATDHAMQKRTLKRAPRKNRRKEAGNVNQDCK
jgi:hypothetical protein